ncbi:ribonuclease III [bacterium]|jgi:ribonuclease-3|nr:ribonuclease III [bacterium]
MFSLSSLRNWLKPTSQNDKEFTAKLQKLLGFKPQELSFYKQSLTHKSSVEDNIGILASNERLEFLGDAVLGSCVADYIYHKYPKSDEGFLTQLRSKMVSRNNLNQVADKLGLGELIIANIDSKQRINSVKGNALEALVGAIYLDRGIDYCVKFIYKLVESNLIDVDRLSKVDENYKSQLIEFGQKSRQEVAFTTVSEEGKGYEKQFVVQVKVGDKILGQGKGRSKKLAEQAAAQQAIKKL